MAAIAQKPFRLQQSNIYIVVVAIFGSALNVWAIANVWRIDNLPLLAWLLLFTLIATAFSAISAQFGISFSISHAVMLATAFLLGPAAAVLVAAIDSVGMWLIHRLGDREKWKGSAEQLVFNAGMVSISAWLGGSFLTIANTAWGDSLFGLVVSWSIGAIAFDQINIWLVSLIVYFQRGILPYRFWLGQRWAMPTNITIAGVGGSLLVTGVHALGANGIFLFALPILLLALPFRIYVRDMEAQLAELEKVNRQLKQLGRRKDHMLAILSHDMRTPLNIIKMTATALEKMPNVPLDKQTRMLRTIIEGEGMLETLVNDIIDIERLQSGRPIELEKTTVDLAALTANVSATMLEQATQKGVLLQQALSDAPILVEGDSNKLLRVVLNLLSNGIKYSERGGQVEIKLTQDRVNAHLTVADQGYGISAEQLPHIFEPYFRADEHRQRAEGNGYGLAIVKAYVEAHAGTVNVRSQPGEGSTFTVSFPLQKVLKK